MSAPQYALIAAGPVPVTVLDVVNGMVRAAGGQVRETRALTLPDNGGGGVAFRIAFDAGGRDPASMREIVAMISHNYPRLVWRFHAAAERPRALVLVGPKAHCAADLLNRQEAGTLGVEIVAVASNQSDLARRAPVAGAAFEFVDTGSRDLEVIEKQVRRLVEQWEPNVVIMARWMRIHSPEFCGWLAAQGIELLNVHHWLQDLKGARPHERAAQLGLRYVGATAHYVTGAGELDAGPILAQAVDEHNLPLPTAEELAELGRPMEIAALAEAVRLHAQARVVPAPDGRLVVFS